MVSLCHRWNKQRLNKRHKRTQFTQAVITRGLAAAEWELKLKATVARRRHRQPCADAAILAAFLPSKLVLQWTAVQWHHRCSPICVGEECEDICVCTLRYQQTHTQMCGPTKGPKRQRVTRRSQTRALRACVILAFLCVHQCHLQTQRTNAAAPSTESSEPCRRYWPTVWHRDLKPQKNLESLTNGGD